MTQGGCDYFKAHEAAAIWDGQLGNIGSSAGYISNTTVIDVNHEVCTAETSLFTQGDNQPTENTFDVYVLVERGADQMWYLDRVLMGPSIDAETTDSAGWDGPHIEKYHHRLLQCWHKHVKNALAYQSDQKDLQHHGKRHSQYDHLCACFATAEFSSHVSYVLCSSGCCQYSILNRR